MNSLKFYRQKNLLSFLLSLLWDTERFWVQYIQSGGQVSCFFRDFSCFWNIWFMDHACGEDCCRRFWVKNKEIRDAEMWGHSIIVDFLLSSVPDLWKRSMWAFKTLYFWTITTVLSYCPRNALDNCFFMCQVYKRDDTELWSRAVWQTRIQISTTVILPLSDCIDPKQTTLS